jgi:hypothetical protein
MWRYGEKNVAYKNLMGNPGGKRQPGGPRGRWEGNMKMGLK